MSMRHEIREVIHDGHQELQEANLAKKAILGANIAGLAFEWGTGNEALIGMIGGTVLKHSNNVLLTAGITGAASVAEQSILGLTTAASIYAFPKTIDSIRRRVLDRRNGKTEAINDNSERQHSRLSAGASRFLSAFALGTSVKAIGDNATEHHSLKENSRSVVADAGLIGGGVAAIAFLAAGATSLGRATGLNGAANVFVDIISSPFTYASAFGLKLAHSWHAKWTARRQRQQEAKLQ